MRKVWQDRLHRPRHALRDRIHSFFCVSSSSPVPLPKGASRHRRHPRQKVGGRCRRRQGWAFLHFFLFCVFAFWRFRGRSPRPPRPRPHDNPRHRESLEHREALAALAGNRSLGTARCARWEPLAALAGNRSLRSLGGPLRQQPHPPIQFCASASSAFLGGRRPTSSAPAVPAPARRSMVRAPARRSLRERKRRREGNAEEERLPPPEILAETHPLTQFCVLAFLRFRGRSPRARRSNPQHRRPQPAPPTLTRTTTATDTTGTARSARWEPRSLGTARSARWEPRPLGTASARSPHRT